MDKFLDHIYLASVGSGASIIGAITFNLLETALHAFVFALVGGVTGLFVKWGWGKLKKLCKNEKNTKQ